MISRLSGFFLYFLGIGFLISIVGLWYIFSWSDSLKKEIPNTIGQTSDRENKPSDCRIITIGDSITAGYNLESKDAYPAVLEGILRENNYHCSVVNAWVSGDTSKGLLDRLDFTLGDSPYSLAILTIGGNDGLRGLPIQDLHDNIRVIVKKLQERKIPVLLTGMQIPNNAASYAKEFRELYPRLAEELGVPLFPFFLEWVAMNPKYTLPDEIHPNSEGYRIIANNLFIFLRDGWYLKTFPVLE